MIERAPVSDDNAGHDLAEDGAPFTCDDDLGVYADILTVDSGGEDPGANRQFILTSR